MEIATTTTVAPRYGAPDWNAARTEWAWAWALHTYGFACLFFLLAFYSFFSLLNLRTVNMHTRPFLSSINLSLCLLGIVRASYLFIDPYESNRLMPPALSRSFALAAYPCLTSAFSLILLALLQITRFHARFVFCESAKCISVFIVFHFVSTIVIGVGAVLHSDMVLLAVATQTIFYLWGLFICSLYMYAGYRMLSVVRFMQRLRRRGDTVRNGVKTPKIKITDENEHTYSLNSDVSIPSFHASREDVLNRRTVLEPTYELDVGDEYDADTSPVRDGGGDVGATRASDDVVFSVGGDEDITCDNDAANVTAASIELAVVGRRTQSLSHDGQRADVADDQEDPIHFLQCKPHGVGDRYRLQMSETNSAKADRSPLRIVLTAMYGASGLGLAVCLLYLYGLYGQFGLTAGQSYAHPWRWYIYQTVCRILELIMGCLMAYVTKQPVNKYQFALRARQSLFAKCNMSGVPPTVSNTKLQL